MERKVMSESRVTPPAELVSTIDATPVTTSQNQRKDRHPERRNPQAAEGVGGGHDDASGRTPALARAKPLASPAANPMRTRTGGDINFPPADRPELRFIARLARKWK